MQVHKVVCFLILSLGLYQPVQAGIIQTYQLTTTNDWNPTDYPNQFPADAHFSWLGGGTHNTNVTFWEEGGYASPGIQQMAETGRVDILVDVDFDNYASNTGYTGEAEFQTAIQAGNAFAETIFEKMYTPEVLPGPGARTASFNVDSDFPLVTLATMLGPSPDWFVGVSGLALFENGSWNDLIEVPLILYDGGTEEGAYPTMDNLPSSPYQPIHTIAYDATTGSYIASDTPSIVGTMRFERVSAVPLPAGALLFLSSILALLGYSRKR